MNKIQKKKTEIGCGIQYMLVNYSFSNRLDSLFGDFYEAPLANNSIRCRQVQVMEASFGVKKKSIGTLCHPLFGDFIYIIFIYFKSFLLP